MQPVAAEVLQGLRDALVGNMLQARAGTLVEELGLQVIGAADAGAAVEQLARIGLGLLHQVLHAFHRRRRRHQDRDRPARQHRDRRQVHRGVEVGLQHRPHAGDGGGMHRQGVAVGRGAETCSVAMVPPAPGLFSMMKGCPNFCWKCGASARAKASMLPPGVKATTIRTGLSGHVDVWACARRNPPAAARATEGSSQHHPTLP